MLASQTAFARCADRPCSSSSSSRDAFPHRPARWMPSRPASAAPALRAPRRGHGMRDTKTSAAGIASDLSKWWEAQTELWVTVHTEEDFWREVSTLENGQEIVLVDWYATWCKSCRAVYPLVCVRAADKQLRKRVKFVKANVDELKKLSKAEQVTALPWIAVYKPEDGQIAAWHSPQSKMRYLNSSIQTILDNPDAAFAVDPNGFVIITGKRAPRAEVLQRQAQKAAEVDAMRKGAEGLFEHLMAVSDRQGGVGEATPATNATAGTAASPAAPVAGKSPSAADIGGSGGGGGSLFDRLMKIGTSSDPTPAPAAAAPAQGANGGAKVQGRPEKAAFLKTTAGMYGYSGMLDKVFDLEVGARLAGDHYMDYMGAGVYTHMQVEGAFEELKGTLYGNPHSVNPSSMRSSDAIDDARARVLRFFNASPVDYHVVFTKSATGALKLVGEGFPWQEGSQFRYLHQNHNSVLGIREFTTRHGGTFQAMDECEVEAWLSGTGEDGEPGATSLFAFPAEENFSGAKFPLSWIDRVRSKGTESTQWRVLVDAAAFVPTNPLDLSRHQPDFVVVSFYKMFGCPTGLGCLLVRADAIDVLQDSYWGGGQVALATAGSDFRVMHCQPSERLEDGTQAFLDIASIKHGFAAIERLGGVKRVQDHVMSLAEWLHQGLKALRHSNGQPLVRCFGKWGAEDLRASQGAVLNFVVMDSRGRAVPHKDFEKLAAKEGFHLRTGAECNPGACYAALGLRDEEVMELEGLMEGCKDEGVQFITVKRPAAAIRSGSVVVGADVAPQSTIRVSEALYNGATGLDWVNVPLGTVRVSLGAWSRWEDCDALLAFLRGHYRQ